MVSGNLKECAGNLKESASDLKESASKLKESSRELKFLQNFTLHQKKASMSSYSTFSRSSLDAFLAVNRATHTDKISVE